MAQIRVSFGDDELKRFENMLGAVGAGQGRAALARAINRTTRSVQSRVVRAVAKQSSIPIKIARRSITAKLAAHKGDGPLVGIVSGIGDDLSLKHFRAKQFSWGVKAKIWGNWKRFPGTFIWAGTYRSGKAVANNHVWQRTSAASFPIELQRGPAVPDEMVTGEAERAYQDVVRTMLPARAMHELTRLLQA